MFLRHKTEMVDHDRALPGRATPLVVPESHFVSGRPLKPPFPPGFSEIVLGLGCFWGAERVFWQLPGVWVTSVGYAGGFTPNPTYDEVCSGKTGHAEVVRVVWDPSAVALGDILRRFWESHDPTQGMRQGNDIGTQYRSVILTVEPGHRESAEASRQAYQRALLDGGHGQITTEIDALDSYFYAESYHQQYLAKNPAGYCGLGGTGVACPVGLASAGS